MLPPQGFGGGVAVVEYFTVKSISIASDRVLLAPNSEASILSLTGEGYFSALFYGDGNDNLRLRVYLDSMLHDDFKCSEARIGIYCFKNRMDLKVFNPNNTNVLGYYPRIELAGVIK